MGALLGNYNDLAKALVRKRADLSKVDDDGNSALHHAAGHCPSGTVRLLLKYRADVKLHNNVGDTAVHAAGRMGNPDFEGVVRTLMEARANLGTSNKDGQTIYDLMVKMGKKQKAEFVLKAAGPGDDE